MFLFLFCFPCLRYFSYLYNAFPNKGKRVGKTILANERTKGGLSFHRREGTDPMNRIHKQLDRTTLWQDPRNR
jgi:hypothetical protein